MTTTYKENTQHEMFVFRVPITLAEKATRKADEMMISRSAICRQALQEFVQSETGGQFTEVLPQY